MKCSDSPSFVARRGIVVSPNWRALFVSIICGVGSAAAQPVTAPPPPAPELSEQGPGATETVLKTSSTSPLQWGPVGLRPHAFYRWMYSEGARARLGQQANTTMNSISPGMTFDLATRWVADYTQTWTYYSNEAFKDRVAHAASLKGGISFTDGSAQFAQTYSLSSESLVETGRQTRQETADTSLVVNYSLGRRSHLVANFSHDLRYVENAPNTREWSTNDSIHYQFSSRLDMAVGLSYGLVDVDQGADMHFVEPQLRVGWRPVDKLRFDAHIGRQHRTFSAGGAAPINSSTYGASASYQPLETTIFTFSANRGVSVSYFANQVTQNSGWTAGFNQRLFKRLNLSGGYTQNHARYIPTAAVIRVGRDDETSNFYLRLGTGFLRHGKVAIVYQHIRNQSNTTGYSFSNNQTGFEVSYGF